MARREIEVKTRDGAAKAGLFQPEREASAGIILYMDIFGPRAALDGMADRLCRHGYAVLVPDLFYRSAPCGPFDAGTAFSREETKQQLMRLRADTNEEMTIGDTGGFLDALGEAGITGPIGVVGYCMGGSRALKAAAAYPDRIAAAASIHGGNLASDAPDSFHRRAGSIRARVYVGTAGVDNSFPPEQSARLAEALRRAEIDHIIENYVGMRHGWAVPDHDAYDPVGAERHWKRLITFFAETLGERHA